MAVEKVCAWLIVKRLGPLTDVARRYITQKRLTAEDPKKLNFEVASAFMIACGQFLNRGKESSAETLRYEAGILDEGVLRVGGLAVVLQGEPPSRAGDSRRGLGVQEPVHDIE